MHPKSIIPESFETERLLIRKPALEDAPEVNNAVTESLDRLKIWMPWAKTAPTLKETTEQTQRAITQWDDRTDMQMRLFLKDTKTMIGSSGLHRIDWSVPRFEIGYWIRTGFEGKGYVTEAVNGITQFAFDVLHANRVEIKMDDRNRRSWRVAEQCGFELEGILRNDKIGIDGSLRDTRVYSKIPTTKTQP